MLTREYPFEFEQKQCEKLINFLLINENKWDDFQLPVNCDFLVRYLFYQVSNALCDIQHPVNSTRCFW